MRAICKNRGRGHGPNRDDATENVFRGPDRCPYCDLAYEDFRTGETFTTVREQLWRSSEDPSKWIYKRRNTVLGLWHEIKQDLWEEHIDFCQYEDEPDDYEDEYLQVETEF